MSPLRGRFGGEQRRHEATHRALLRGDGIDLPCRLRRTSARGWGPWIDAVLALGALPDGEARWRVADPVAVGFPITRGPIDLTFTEVTEVFLRPVRFQTEAFYGKAGEIVVLAADRGTIEVALRPEHAGPVAVRLDELLFPGR